MSETFDKLRQVNRNLNQKRDRELADNFEDHFRQIIFSENKEAENQSQRELEC